MGTGRKEGGEGGEGGPPCPGVSFGVENQSVGTTAKSGKNGDFGVRATKRRTTIWRCIRQCDIDWDKFDVWRNELITKRK